MYHEKLWLPYKSWFEASWAAGSKAVISWARSAVSAAKRDLISPTSEACSISSRSLASASGNWAVDWKIKIHILRGFSKAFFIGTSVVKPTIIVYIMSILNLHDYNTSKIRIAIILSVVYRHLSMVSRRGNCQFSRFWSVSVSFV